MRGSVLFIVLTFIFVIQTIHAQEETLKATQINSQIIHLSVVHNVVYSASGKFVAIQGRSKFILLPTKNLNKSINSFWQVRQWDGEVIGFLPSEKLVYSADDKIFAIDPNTSTNTQLLSRSAVKAREEYWTSESFLIVSDNLIISGTGDRGMGGFSGNIYKHDLKRKQIVKGAKISEFSSPQLSPSSRYILHDYGGSDSNFTNIYDIRQNKNYEAAKYFNLRKAFPKFKTTNEAPLHWLTGQDRFLAIISTGLHPDLITPKNEAEQSKEWLVLFDVPTRRIIWKKLFKKDFYISAYDQIDVDRFLVSYHDRGVYEISLKTGVERKYPTLDCKSFSISPNKKQIAYIAANQLFVSDVNGGNKKRLLDLPPENEAHEYYKNLVLTTPLWSKSGDAVYLYDGDKSVIIHLSEK